MQAHSIVQEYSKGFKSKDQLFSKGIGIECELPIVTWQGKAVSLKVLENLFFYLEEEGFELKQDEYSNRITAATRVNPTSALTYNYCTDTITTDLGFSTLEIALAPQENLFIVQAQLSKLLLLVLNYFDSQNCRLLGYGIQPFTSPSKQLMVPHKRYNFIGRTSGNKIVPKLDGKDYDLLTVSASNQCHVEVSLEEAIPAVNVLNALSGLQIALQANSPIWKGQIDPKYKANRELFWNYCFPDRLNQAGIPSKFKDMEAYVENLMSFKSQRVIRNKKPYRIVTNNTFQEFINGEKPTIGEDRFGNQKIIEPQVTDIHTQNGFCYYNARLVSKFGTIENRMCCQQPPKETMVTSALTLGILENLEEAQFLVKELSFVSPEKLRMEAIQHALDAQLEGESIVPYLYQVLHIAEKGLKNRGFGEEVFLEPLFRRLEILQTPADAAIDVFEQEGKEAFLKAISFKSGKILKGAKEVSFKGEKVEVFFFKKINF